MYNGTLERPKSVVYRRHMLGEFEMFYLSLKHLYSVLILW